MWDKAAPCSWAVGASGAAVRARCRRCNTSLRPHGPAVPSNGTKLLPEFFPQVAEWTKAWLLGKFVPRELWCSEGHQLKLSHVEMTADLLSTEIYSVSLLLYEPLNYFISATFVSMLSCFSFHAVRPLNKVQITYHFSSILWHLPLLCLSGVSITFGHQLEKNWCVQHGRAQTCGTALNLSREKVWLEGRTGPN